MTTYINQLMINLRFADVLDILAVALLLYIGLHWVRRRTSRAVALVAALLILLFLAAHAMGMFLTLFFFQAGFAILILALVIIFQQDIRHTFERIITWRPLGRRLAVDWSDMLDILTETVHLLAKQHTGALIVLKGQQPLEHHIRGGLQLKGYPSVPLLLSIFHHATPGHDGAILIDGNRIEKFGVHLPLTRNLGKIGAGGTRHAAALGLAECSDAFIIVVSEERGSISIAHDGQLIQVDSGAELRAALTSFCEDTYAPRPTRHWAITLTQNLSLKIISLGLASVLWLAIAYRPENIQRTVDAVPIEFRNLREGWVIEEVKPPRITVTLIGPEQDFRNLDDTKLKFSLDLGGLAEEGHKTIPLSEKLLDIPHRLTARLDPKTVDLTIYRRNIYQRPVVPNWQWGKPNPDDFTVQIEPATVRVEMRVADANDIKEISTEPIPFDGFPKTFQVPLQLPNNVVIPGDQPPQISVRISPVEKQPKEKQVNILSDTERFIPMPPGILSGW